VNQSLTKTKKIVDFEELGFQTMLQCGDIEIAKPICALELQAYAEGVQQELGRLGSEIQQNQHRGAALHANLYDRPIPVNDASMLTQGRKIRILMVLTFFAAIACLVGNTTTFYLFGFGFLLTLLLAAGTTALPLVVGHAAYERIVAGYKRLQIAVIVVAAALCAGGILRLAEARQMMVDRAATTPATASYIDGTGADSPTDPEPAPQNNSESKIRQTLSGAMLLIMIAADVILGFLVGQLSHMHTDDDYAAWRNLKIIGELVVGLQTRVSELLSSIEIAKKRCMAGILRAQSARGKRRVPYHQSLSVVIAVLFPILAVSVSQGQTIEHEEGILIDTSASIAKGNSVHDLFHEYIVSTKSLLLTEPTNSRVWVSSIANDSFGGVGEIVKGWTPDARGVFTDDLNRARRQLVFEFQDKSSSMAPVASGTDIFGALWHMKALFESTSESGAPRAASKAIWIFSDMMNETKEFPMPTLVAMGPQRMLERAQGHGLLVPLRGYRIYIYGASPKGLTAEVWKALRDFWTIYFSASGAELVSYSAECKVLR